MSRPHKLSAEAAGRTKLSPPEIAQRWGISVDKVLTWIRNGELRAINAATRPGGSPRYLVDVADLAVFEAARQAGPEPAQRPRLHRRKQPADPGFVRYFS